MDGDIWEIGNECGTGKFGSECGGWGNWKDFLIHLIHLITPSTNVRFVFHSEKVRIQV